MRETDYNNELINLYHDSENVLKFELWELYDKRDKAALSMKTIIIGNADTRFLLNGTKEQIRAEVQRCMDIGKKCPGFFMAVGNHIPPNTPVENALYYNEVYEEIGKT